VIAIRNYAIFVCMLVSLLGCASSIVDGEYLRTSPTIYPLKSDSAIVEVFLSGKSANRKTVDIGKVSARAYVLEKGIDELREQAKELGADAITNVSYERKFSMDYLQDLYFIDGDAVIYE